MSVILEACHLSSVVIQGGFKSFWSTYGQLVMRSASINVFWELRHTQRGSGV